MPKDNEAPLERVKYPGADSPIQPVREERVKPRTQPNDDDDDEGAEEAAPKYRREELGPRIGSNGIETAKAVAEVTEQLDTEDCVPMIFPREVRLQDRGIMHVWGAGVHLVPVSLAGTDPKGKDRHFYLKAHKVRRAGNPLPNPNKPAGDNDDGPEAA